MGQVIAKINYQTEDNWIGKKFDRWYERRNVVLKKVRTIMHSPTPKQEFVTTDMHDVEAVPSFIIDLESDVYSCDRK